MLRLEMRYLVRGGGGYICGLSFIGFEGYITSGISSLKFFF